MGINTGRPLFKQPIIAILLAGFATLVVLVGVLTYISLNRFDEVRIQLTTIERKYLRNHELATNFWSFIEEIHDEARIREIKRAQSLKGSDTSIRNIRVLRGEILRVAKEINDSNLNGESSEAWAKVNAGLEPFLDSQENPDEYALNGATRYERLMIAKKDFRDSLEKQKSEVQSRGDELRSQAGRQIRITGFTIILLCIVVAAASMIEITRRLRDLDHSNRANIASREFARNILNSMVEGLFAINADGIVISANQILQRIVDLPAPTFVSADYRDVFRNYSRLTALIDEARRDPRQRKSYAGRITLGPGVEHFDIYVSPFFSGGQREGLIFTLIDVTEVERAEEELRRQAALAAIGQMTAQVAHEIKNPIGGIKLNLSYLKRKFKDNEEGLEVISDLDAQVERLHQTVLEINQFGRPRDLKLRDINLNDLIDEQLSQIKDQFDSKHIKIVRHYQGDLPDGFYDNSEMSKVFINLLLNAAEASAENHAVEITTTVTGSGSIMVEIRDEGVGMNEETIARMFEPFYTTKRDGTGLGMATVKKIIEQHRGSIDVESSPGKGTTFRVYLPLDGVRRHNAVDQDQPQLTDSRR